MLKDACCILVLSFVLFSCSQKDPVATIPTYLYVPEFTVDSTKSDMELFSSNISDVWVYVDNNNQGAYELPATIPIAETGTHKIELRPGIKNGGIATARRPYPYYALYELSNYKMQAGKVDTLDAVITYYDTDPTPITIAWEEGFESLGPSYEIKNGSDTGVTILNRADYPDLVFKDNRSGAVFLKEPQFRFELISPTFNNLPRSNIPIYLEINYKTNHPFTVGIYRNNKSEQIAIYIVKEQENWNKIYLDISSNVQSSNPGANFNIFIGFQRQQSISSVEMYFDNIKLIHY